ncbi:MAG: phosphatidylserine decarboxylase [bacterium]|nr:phosphatidylserine decarboxylase [bacterium]
MTRNTILSVLGCAIVLILISGLSTAAGAHQPDHPDRPAGVQKCPALGRQPATKALMELVASDDQLRLSLMESIALGQRINNDPRTNPVASIADYYDFVDALVTYDPRNINTGLQRDGIRISMDGDKYCNWNILDILAYSYFLVDRQITTDPRGQIQFANPEFSNWMRQIAESWGQYLETPDSARYVPDFEGDPNFGDWYCPAQPYDTFQEFFTRELCAKTFPNCSRPVQGYDDPLTVVSVADSNTLGSWPISSDGKLVTSYDGISQSGQLIKGQLYSDVHAFITGGADETILKGFGELDPALFDGGTFTHQFLNVNNYHRLHVPVAGKVVYMRHIQSGTRMKSGWKPPLGVTDVGYYDPRDTPDWQFGQTRLVLGIETPNHGMVLASPMGMAQVASIELRKWVEEGVMTEKGWEFGNFAFGGSDFVVIFEAQAEFVLTVPHMPEDPPAAGVNYEPSFQGQKYGCFGGDDRCSSEPGSPPPFPGCTSSRPAQ